ncbi:MAG TPA: DUF3805 domain-containing protein [Leptospiraceae bacterium]|nr:DUF3805 domain-containing protein [Leptospiraceae bacterium]HMW07652.1 DUF3805 domain-containing protein [Leptospiraceae bacterium]HMX34002.1 DUF3805 domain-containing protein [Leptospiraceae bacterium]HMY33229.1 DUF3805 domain-containing protein [Leptospiraceae bacterium]HMZ65735.1 DUF3805 domain-containing protein [Leptospiraceae bacterium]
MSEIHYQPYRSPNGWYILAYPEHWEVEIIEEIPAFFDPDGAGALQVSAFENKLGSYDLSEELERFLSVHKISYDEERVATFTNNLGSQIKACEFIADERFWLVYMISSGSKLIVCTYNSDETPDRELSVIITNIISSIQFLNHE